MNNLGDPDLLNKLTATLDECDRCVQQMKDHGRQKDEAARAYYSARTKAAYQLREQGESATMISLLVKGLPDVSIKKLQYDSAYTMYETDREALMLLKVKAKILEAQIDREWGASRG